MKKEELIKKWLDNNLGAQEQKAFEQLEDYNELIRLNKALKSFHSPNFSIDKGYDDLKKRLVINKKEPKHWYRPLLRIAAILAICFGTYYYTTTLETEIRTDFAEKTQILLPDDSSIDLNSNTIVVYNKSNWSKKRQLKLNGEAYFKVAKGQKFDVVTYYGTVSVLGTEFNVKQRKDYFEVTCYEGSVAVNYNSKITKLNPGHQFLIRDGKSIAKEKENAKQPLWLNYESSFKNTALKYVIDELEIQYNIKINADNIDTTRSYTGSFTHKNLDLALQSVTIPLNLSYSKTDNSIVLKRE